MILNFKINYGKQVHQRNVTNFQEAYTKNILAFGNQNSGNPAPNDHLAITFFYHHAQKFITN